ncbi:SPW repeat domain-containing protein [Roseibium album]|uniref:SPW repeat domain-containing protein n=1 Tax=Roseibium album TaxID=311410 RepID=UPI002490B05F|nr:hypothetical protein [Roseibium album]
MNIRFVTKNIHAYLDYPVALGLIGLPVVLNLGQSNPLAFWLSVVTGVAALIVTMLTDHETGLIRVVPYSFHLIVDFAVGVVFLAAPFVLGFKGIDFAYYVVNALAVLTVVSLHKPEAAEPQVA